MPQIEMIMPRMGESIAEATILKWLKNVGDPVEADESIVEVATDKVDSEVPSPVKGIIVKRLFEEGQVVQVGMAIAILESETPVKPQQPNIPTPASTPVKREIPLSDYSEKIVEPTSAIALGSPVSGSKFYSPLVRSIAQQEGISVDELDAISGTGIEGRLTKKDLLDYLSKGSRPAKIQAAPTVNAEVPSAPDILPSTAPVTIAAPKFQAPPFPYKPSVYSSDGAEIIEMDRMRKYIAEHMILSKQTSAHVTSFVEADVTNIVVWREKVKAAFEKRENEKITYTPVFVEAVTRAIKDFPMVNVSVEGTRIILKKNINIGLATALPNGNLIVPVIKNADQKNLTGLTKSVNDLAARARSGKLLPDEIKDGTFTLTNIGSFGNIAGTPIINQPEVAILAVGAIKKKPAVIETPGGDFIGIRHLMFLSLSYDHRVVDGALGGSFLKRVADYLESFDVNTAL